MSNKHHTVAKPFNTPSRRFKVGEEVSPDQVTGPVRFDDFLRSGHIAPPEKAATKPGKAAAPDPGTEAAAD